MHKPVPGEFNIYPRIFPAAKTAAGGYIFFKDDANFNFD